MTVVSKNVIYAILIVCLIAGIFVGFFIIRDSDISIRNLSVTLDGHVKGSTSAEILIVEISDYQCPFCKKFIEQSMPSIKNNYIDKGIVKFIFKNFPLLGHRNAKTSAEAAECAGKEGKFWEMHDAIFGNQNVWSSLENPDASVQSIAINMNTSIKACMDNDETLEKINSDYNELSKNRISSTPSFYILIKRTDKAETRIKNLVSLLNQKYKQAGIEFHVIAIEDYIGTDPVGALPYPVFREIIEGFLSID